MSETVITRRNFLKGASVMFAAGALSALSGCSASGSGAAAGSSDAQAGGTNDPITIVWLPDNSSADLSAAREAIGAAVTAACGREAKP